MRLTMKKVICTLCIMATLALSGCAGGVKMPDDPVIFEQNSTEEYAYLRNGDKVYVPYCPYERKYMDGCIGYYDLPGDEYTSGGRIYIYGFKGYSPDEWIIEFDAEGGKDGMILKELNAADIPESLTSEYEWNK